MAERSLLIPAVVLLVVGGAFLVLKEQATVPGETGLLGERNIIVTSPQSGEIVSNPIIITGKARVFEGVFQYRLVDINGKILFAGHAMTTGPGVPDYGDFRVKIPVSAGASRQLFVQVFEYSAKDGSIINQVEVPVTLGSQATTTVRAYFMNDRLDPQITCTKVFPVTRTILKTPEVGYLALAELLKGPTAAEQRQQYGTTVPDGTLVNSLVIRDGIAYADFNEGLEAYGGGSCRVAAIRAQITETLKQFPTVNEVVISVNGRTEDILQP